MARRTALLIRCSINEAKLIRERAAAERRTISAYILLKLTRALSVEDSLFDELKHSGRLLPNEEYASPLPGRKTALLLRCTVEEANQVRKAARRREMSLSEFVLYVLRRGWAAAERIQHLAPPGMREAR